MGCFNLQNIGNCQRYFHRGLRFHPNRFVSRSVFCNCGPLEEVPYKQWWQKSNKNNSCNRCCHMVACGFMRYASIGRFTHQSDMR
ncbi:hypothetical protein HUJ05_006799 [Dendroctonus ponderosae]|nr:hypothetical protein HUJ05_008575 [Dendroctonus ponderosae]KAH0998902.1 hypothetical protein HUJ05_006799 [Dendroctonus ponderosae]